MQLEERGVEYLAGVVDLHVYAAPSVYNERAFTEIELATQAREVGYRGLLFKDHQTINADRAQYVRTLVPRIEAHGGVVLNYAVGGLNPRAVEAAISYRAKCVWMPSLDAAGHETHFGSLEYPNMSMKFVGKLRPLRGITIFDADKKILPEVYDILSMIRDADIILGLGQLTKEEIFALIRSARDMGITKLLVEHAEAAVTKLTPDEQAELAKMGASIQHAYAVVFYRETSIKEVAEGIKRHGAASGVLASDCGNVYNPHPIEAMRLFIMTLMRAGISRDEIVLLTQKVPASLLNLS
jgi:hypothetical protein